jgi:hypothetical protein
MTSKEWDKIWYHDKEYKKLHYTKDDYIIEREARMIVETLLKIEHIGELGMFLRLSEDEGYDMSEYVALVEKKRNLK